jgi:phosphatidylglycerol:prolipoprotein diacylglycerol transferase
MNPIAFTIFGMDIRWYGIMISLGMLLGILLAKFSSKLRGIDYDELLNVVLISLPIGIIGARFYYVIFNLDYYMANKAEILNIRAGGLAIHGGLIFGILSACIYLRYKKISFLEYADAAVPSIILAQALGRWGNFFNQEAHGGPVSYEFISKFPQFIQNGMNIGGVYYHPTFLYESIWNIGVMVVLLILLKKSLKEGIALFSYIGLYSLGRYFIEGLRTDSLMLGPFRQAQLISLTGVAVWIVFLLISRRRKNVDTE